MATIYINGKFTAQRTTGVQRVARCLIAALDARLAWAQPGACEQWVLLCPPGAQPPSLQRIEVRTCGSAAGGLNAWEQLHLPVTSRNGLLLNMTGSAPLFKRHQVCWLHDAAVFDHPEAYTRAFTTWYGVLHRRLARSAALIVTVSAFSKARLQARLGVPAQRVAIVSNGADHLAPLAADPSLVDALHLRGQPFVLAVGSANPTKNFAVLRQAFGALPASIDLKLLMVGGAHTAVFAGSAALAPADPRIVPLGAVSDAQLKALYEHATGLVFPSLYEGFGLPIVEAMACGCPVAASSAASMPEVCGDAALMFEPTSVPAITAAIQRLAGDAELRQQLRARGLQRAAHFSWNAAAATLLAALSAAGLSAAGPRGRA